MKNCIVAAAATAILLGVVGVPAEEKQEVIDKPAPMAYTLPVVELKTVEVEPVEVEPVEEEAETMVETSRYSDAIPMSYEYQEWMQTYCEKYGCPYSLALAVAETESHFNMAAVGSIGEVGMMQLNPGPGDSYHAELQGWTGLDPDTPEGNIAGSCYLLGKYKGLYNDSTKAAMAYNMGHGGAKRAWAKGITSTSYSRAVVEAQGRWESVIGSEE